MTRLCQDAAVTNESGMNRVNPSQGRGFDQVAVNSQSLTPVTDFLAYVNAFCDICEDDGQVDSGNNVPFHHTNLRGELLLFSSISVTQLAGLLMRSCLFILARPQKNKSSKPTSKIKRLPVSLQVYSIILNNRGKISEHPPGPNTNVLSES